MQACLVSGRPMVVGYPGASVASRNACCTISGVGSIGVPIERSTTPSGMRARLLGGGRQLVPGEVRETPGDGSSAPLWCSRRVEIPRQAHSWFCGGRPAIIGWSLSISPILAAPPGEPRSSKKCTLAS